MSESAQKGLGPVNAKLTLRMVRFFAGLPSDAGHPPHVKRVRLVCGGSGRWEACLPAGRHEARITRAAERRLLRF
jgi:hypothetical protein